VPHNCHQDDENCPKCPFLTTKPCLCGKDQLKNQPCWLQDVRCGKICGRRLKCGFHHCRKTCHKPGECEDAGQSCQQNCGKEKTCTHPCEYKCHVPSICKEDKPCQHKIFITCDCQRIKQEAKCGATRSNAGNGTKSLKCDDECSRLERNRKLALALNIDPDNRQDDHIPYQAETLNMYLESPTWAQAQEKELRAFAIDPELKRKRFEPMKTRQRAFLHSLAEDFGFDTESMDPEPHRHVAVFKTPRFVMAPMKTLAECARIRQIQRAMTQQAANEALKAKATASSASGKASNIVGDPFNAFLVSNARFGLTVEELRSALTPTLTLPSTAVQLDISFLPSEDIVLLPTGHTFPTSRALEDHLTTLKTSLAKSLAGPPFLGRLQLCRVDDSLNILRRESDEATGGWSQVAKAAAAPKRAPLESGLKVTRGGFAVFETAAARAKKEGASSGGENGEKRKKVALKRQVTVEDDWEAAQLRDEERERAANSAEQSGDEVVADGAASASEVPETEVA
jgi:transcriptional repressor NF-X1